MYKYAVRAVDKSGGFIMAGKVLSEHHKLKPAIASAMKFSRRASTNKLAGVYKGDVTGLMHLYSDGKRW